MNNTISLILGHHPLLSITEVLSALDNRVRIMHADRSFIVVDGKWEKELLKQAPTLGGLVKIVRTMARVEKGSLYETVRILLDRKLATHEGKFLLSLSVHGRYRKYQTEFLRKLKGETKSEEKNIRIVHKDMQRNVAPIVLLKQRVIEKGVDIVVCDLGDGTFTIGETIWLHDPEPIGMRDMEKPVRDMKVGMMPPKVAMALLHLAFPGESIKGNIMWDPFGGLGVIPLEAMEMGADAIASDIEPRMVEAMETNLTWAKEKLGVSKAYHVYEQDATTIGELPVLGKKKPSTIVTEGYLGTNFQRRPHRDEMESAMNDVDKMHIQFFKSLVSAGFKGTVVVTFPYYPIGFKAVRMTSLLNALTRMGMEVVPLLHESQRRTLEQDRDILNGYTRDGTILYTRGDQFVGREVVKLRVG